jgi:long-chain acyl-CoA synthetase
MSNQQPNQPQMQSINDFVTFLENHGDAVALVMHPEGTQVTYSELTRKVYSLIDVIRPHITPGDRVLLYKLEAVDWVVSFFALLAVGGVVVTADNRSPKVFIDDIIELTKPRHYFYADEKPDIPGASLLQLSAIGLSVETMPNLQPVDPTTPAQIVFTSGTWSKPKGVTLSQQNIVANFAQNIQHFPVSSNDRLLSILPLTHIYEQMAGVFVPMFYGASIHFAPLATSDDFKKALKKVKPTKLVVVPLVLELLQESYRKSFSILYPIISRLIYASRILPIALRRLVWFLLRGPLGGRLQHLIVGGAPLRIEVDRFFQGLGVRVDVGYGLSETSPVLSVSFNQNRKPGEVGQAYPIFELRQNEQGELLVRGPSVFMGYWPNISNTDQTWFNTGDIVIKDPKGNLIIQGRSKNIIIYPSGDKIFAEDIEVMANDFPEVKDTCCLDTGLGLETNLVLVFAGQNVNKEKLKQYMKSRLPVFVTIAAVIDYGEDEMPKTYSRKLNRKAVQDWLVMTQSMRRPE